MAPIRLRHPKGSSTIEVGLDSEEFTVQEMQQKIYAVSGILPSRQILKAGYPPRSLTLIPELPVSSLGLEKGDQIIANEVSNSVLSGDTSQGVGPSPVATRSTKPPGSVSKISGPDSVEVEGSFLIHRVVPDDNSCLFSSVALIFEQDMSKAPHMRKIIADGIKGDPGKYDEAVLGMPPAKYVDIITKPNSWGGAIELTIFAAHYNTEIASVDVETGRIDYYSPPEPESNIPSTAMRCIVIYSGIHYDAASLAPTVDAPAEWHQTLFEIHSNDDSDPIVVAAKKLAGILRSKKAFTNTATFDLKCEQCGKGLKGEKEARAHAEQTGHVRFGEY